MRKREGFRWDLMDFVAIGKLEVDQLIKSESCYALAWGQHI